MKSLQETLDNLGIDQEEAEQAADMFHEEVGQRISEAVEAQMDDLREAIDEYTAHTADSVTMLEDTVADLCQIMTGDEDDRLAAIHRIVQRSKARAVDAHDPNWGKEAPDDAGSNRASIRSRGGSARSGQSGFGEPQSEEQDDMARAEARMVVENVVRAHRLTPAAFVQLGSQVGEIGYEGGNPEGLYEVLDEAAAVASYADAISRTNKR